MVLIAAKVGFLISIIGVIASLRNFFGDSARLKRRLARPDDGPHSDMDDTILSMAKFALHDSRRTLIGYGLTALLFACLVILIS